MLTNCVNCGAPLRCGKCEYCGTEYAQETTKVRAEFGVHDTYGTIQIGEKTFECYLARMEAEILSGPGAGRSIDGTLHRRCIATKHKFTLIER